MKRGSSWGRSPVASLQAIIGQVRSSSQQTGRRTRPSLESRAAAGPLLDSGRISEQEATRTNRWWDEVTATSEREREWEPLRGVGGRVRQAHFRGSKWLLRSPRPRFPLMDGEAGASPDSPRTDSEDSDLRRRRDVEPLCSAPGFVLMLRMCCAETKSPPQGQPSVSTNLIT